MIALKGGVKAKGIQSELLLAVMVIDGVYTRNHCPLTITSLTDGQHSPDSLHYKGYALDCRTRDISVPLLDVIVREIKESLGSDYDVVLEGDHLHVEYDPK